MKKQLPLFILLGASLVFFLALYVTTMSTTNSSQPSSVTNTVVQCDRDSDCMVGGCSGQYCLPRSQQQSTYSTCEWNAAYACYAQDNCVCQNHQCAWFGTRQYQECIQALRQ